MDKPEALFLADELEAPLGTVIGAELYRRAAAELRRLHAQRDALKTYGWHTEDCPQHPTYARPKNWPDCICGFDAAIKMVEETK